MTADGAVQRRRARSSGTVVEVWRAADLGLGDDGDAVGQWVTVCEHGSSCHHDTRAIAIGWAAVPEQWCETGCRHAAYRRDGCATCGGRLAWAEDQWTCRACGDEFHCPCAECRGEVG